MRSDCSYINSSTKVLVHVFCRFSDFENVCNNSVRIFVTFGKAVNGLQTSKTANNGNNFNIEWMKTPLINENGFVKYIFCSLHSHVFFLHTVLFITIELYANNEHVANINELLFSCQLSERTKTPTHTKENKLKNAISSPKSKDSNKAHIKSGECTMHSAYTVQSLILHK